MSFALAIHGGAGLVRRGSLTPARERAAREALAEALDAGARVLAADGSAVDASVTAVRVLEDCPLFNAGRGAVFAADGTQRMDAAVADGRTRSVGAVAAVRRLRSPAAAAELVRRVGGPVLLVADEAERFAAEHGAELVDSSWFFDAERWAHLERARAAGRTALDHELEDDEPKGTVGCVARDAAGHLAAVTSTGGLANKHPGRVGDSPIAGAGTWADARVAVSATGTGEAILRGHTAGRLADWVELGGLSLADAAARVIAELEALGGAGGVIAVDRGGRVALPFGTAGMYRAWRDLSGRSEVAIW